MKLVALVCVPPGVVTAILPVVAPDGTVAVILCAALMMKVAGVPLKKTPVAPVKFVPLIVTLAPAPPPAGVKPVIVGTIAKVAVQVLSALTGTTPSAQSASPVQPAKTDPAPGIVLRVTIVPSMKDRVQAVPQSIPKGVLFTVPVPLPVFVTVRVEVPGGGDANGVR